MITTRALANLERMKEKIPLWAKDAILENKEDILNILKYAQLGKGKNSFGRPLKWNGGNGYYAPATQEIANDDPYYSHEMPKPNGQAYNFNWSGNTFNFMDLSIDTSKSEYDIFTRGGKQQLLESIYGEIFKLTKEHNFWVNKNIIEPYISEKMIENMFSF